MASMADYAEKATLDWWLGGSNPTRPTTRYVHLYTTDPDEADAGGVEVSTGSWTNYARQAATFGAAAGASPAQALNTNLVDFGTATTTGNITVVGFEIRDQAGNPVYGPFPFVTPVIVQNGNPVYFPIGGLACTQD